MIDKRILNYLDETDEFKLVPEFQEKFKRVLLNQKVSENSALFDLMTTYSGEFRGSEGFIINVAEDLEDFENSVTKNLLDNENVPDNYISLFNFELEGYLLYDKTNDSVVLIETGDIDKLLSKQFDKEWKSSNDFLVDFFELS
jgi:hypothetical protein